MAINLERCRMFAKLLDKLSIDPLPGTQFNMNHWGKLRGESCGTAACALGHAALFEPFQKEGLEMKGDKYWNEGYKTVKTPEDMKSYNDFQVCYKGLSAYEAGYAFFGIPKPDSTEYSFFYPRRNNSTPADVARNLRAIVKAETGEEI